MASDYFIYLSYAFYSAFDVIMANSTFMVVDYRELIGSIFLSTVYY